jgi:small conductance mechanosensitive channel
MEVRILMKKHKFMLIRVLVGIAVIVLLSIFLRDETIKTGTTLWEKLKNSVPELITLLFLIVFAPKITRWALDSVFRFGPKGKQQFEQRMSTLRGLFLSLANVAFILTACLIFLGIFIDVKPLLAGLGIVGFALGFGFQNAVKDFISGILILIENQYATGDSIRVGTFEGKVSRITLRLTVLEGADGEITIPNGSVVSSGIVNFSRKPPVKTKSSS